ncbi:cupin domain-containing protein [Caballeronia novacaledonica]|jgi:quercetin dioxygenase-like cupin family protein|uniref:Cupin domain-containing protein n=2 Tax=Caballeronia TaxID=1827195 RepID=A0ACB5QMX8_9BURK|nr:cupin domain-containing protein [Caballeronia novacaledonica]
MKTDFLHGEQNAAPIDIPAIGLRLQVRIASKATGASATLLETTDQPGFGPPQHRHEIETEVFHVVQGRYLFDVDGKQTIVSAGETIVAKQGTTHRFINIDDQPSRMLVLVTPGWDATRFFSELGDVMANGSPDPAVLKAFGDEWRIEFVGPPLTMPAELAPDALSA